MKPRALAQKKETAKALKTSKKMKKVQKALSQLSDDDLNHAVQQRAAAAKAVAKAAPKAAAALQVRCRFGIVG